MNAFVRKQFSFQRLYLCGLFITFQVLEVMWELAHQTQLTTFLVEQALEHHLAILNEAYTVKEQIKKSYVIKCVDDIKKVNTSMDLPNMEIGGKIGQKTPF